VLEVKQCYKCRKELPLDQFYALKLPRKIKYDCYCKECRRLYLMDYREKHTIEQHLYKKEPCKKFRQDRPRRNFCDFSDYFRLNQYRFKELYGMDYNIENIEKAFQQLTNLLKELEV